MGDVGQLDRAGVERELALLGARNRFKVGDEAMQPRGLFGQGVKGGLVDGQYPVADRFDRSLQRGKRRAQLVAEIGEQASPEFL